MSAFPLTLPSWNRSPQTEDPGLIWPTPYSRSSDSSCGSSESNPCSPSESISSFAFSPASDTSNSILVPPLSACSVNSNGYTNGHSVTLPDGHAAIRAAGKLGVRKQRSMNRNSWSPFSSSAQPRSSVAVAVSMTTTPPTPVPERNETETILVNKPIKLQTGKLRK